MEPDARRQYRSAPNKSTGLEIEVVEGERQFSARLVDTSIGGIRIWLAEAPVTPTYDTGDTITLRIYSHGKPIVTSEPGSIERAEHCEQGWLYGVKFVDWMGLIERLPAELLQHFNRRRTVRVKPEGEEEIQIYFEADEVAKVMYGHLCDLSADGVSFAVRPTDGAHLKRAKFILASFRIPNTESYISFPAVLRRSLEKADCWIFGAFFHDDREDHEAKRQIIIDHIGDEKKQLFLGIQLNVD